MNAHSRPESCPSTMCARQQLLLSAAEYQALGFALLPVKFRQKKPALRSWKQFQRSRADDATVRDWFADADSGQLGIAIICGKVSGGLLVRDFDQRDAYNSWKRSNRNLARKLPTVETTRGFQVYCRSEGYKPATSRTYVHTYSDGSGELRGDGHYVIAPPSLHEKSGKAYRWVNPLADSIPLVEVGAFGVSPLSGTGTHAMSVPPLGLGILPGLEQLPFANEVSAAIYATLPCKVGQRNRLIFEFARRLKGIDQLAGFTPHELRPYVECWFLTALPVIGTKDFAITTADFRLAWQNVRYAPTGSIKRALERARLPGPLPASADRFGPQARLLLRLCVELQWEGNGRTFFLQSRDAANAVGLVGLNAHRRAWRWLETFCEMGLIHKVHSGCLKDGLANEYAYLGKTD